MANLGCKFDPEILTKKEVAAILCSFPPTRIGVRNRALVAVYLYGQLRCNEALDVRAADIDWERGALTVRRGKGGKRRVVGLPCEILEKYVRPWARERGDSSYYFHSKTGKRLHDSCVRRLVAQAAERAGITHRVHTHSLRHTGACMLAAAGTEIRIISAQLGHSNISTTDRYLRHLSGDDIIRGVQAAWKNIL